jgi:hypothetical protein
LKHLDNHRYRQEDLSARVQKRQEALTRGNRLVKSRQGDIRWETIRSVDIR